MLWLAVRTARTHRVVSFCILWFFGNLVIESSVVALEILFEHRTYLPSVGVFLLIVSLSRQYVAQPWLRRGALSAVVMLFAVWTQERVITWSDSVALYRDVVAKAPDLPRGHLNLAIYLARTGDRAGAIEHMLEVVRLYPPHFDAHYALGQQFALDERFEEAEDHFLEATRINPESAAAYAALAARGESPLAFDEREILAACVAPPSNTGGILSRRALPARRLARLGATPTFTTGC